MGFCRGAALPTASAMVGLLTSERRRAAAYSLMASATSFGIAVGPLVGGALGALYGLRPVFLVTASVLILVALVVATTVHEPSTEPAEEPSVAATRPVTRRLPSGARGRK